MAKGLTRQQLLTYARAGAQARINELRSELAALESAFGRGVASARSSAGSTKATRKRRKMSKAGRAKIAAAAKARWAKWRKENAK